MYEGSGRDMTFNSVRIVDNASYRNRQKVPDVSWTKTEIPDFLLADDTFRRDIQDKTATWNH